jgi:hypothetical protein
MDLDHYKARSGRLDVSDLDFTAFGDRPLDAASLRCLRYMHDVEYHTVCYLRDLLVTAAHKDQTITSFLTIWNFEEFWHGEAIGAVLDVHGERPRTAHIEAMRRNLGWKDHVAPIAHIIGSKLAGESFLAIHMTWGAINEWTAQAAYARLIARAQHPTLTTLLRRIMRDEGRHVDFYAPQAHERLTDDRRAQLLTRLALRRFWAPVGSTVMPKAESEFISQYLFAGPDGRAMATRIDTRIDHLPGLSGLALMTGSAPPRSNSSW